MNAQPAASPAATIVAVGGYCIDIGRAALLAPDGSVVDMRPQAWSVLQQLALNAGRVVTKDELLAAVWPGVVVTDDSLVQAVGDVRRALGSAGRDAVRTVPRRGYMLLAGRSVPVPRTSRRGWWLAGGFAALACCVAALWSGAMSPRAPPPELSVAVLPFRDPARSSDGAALARAVAADLVVELARSPDLRVVSHQSSFQFNGDGATPLAEIARRLRSRYVVDGTVRRDGESLRLAVELIDSDSGHVLWSAASTVPGGGLADVQREWSGRIAGTLLSRVQRTETRRVLAQPPKSLDAVALTEHGRSSMQRYDADGMRDARRLLQQALTVDGGYAPAWVFLGMTNTIDAGLRLTGDWTRARMPEVLVQVKRAVALQPDLPVAWVALSQAEALAGDHDAALAAAEQCMRLSPNDSDCLYIVGKAQLDIGLTQPALRNLAQALDRNPLAPAFLPAFHATALWAEGRHADAVDMADRCLALAPAFWRCRQDRIAALVGLGRLPEARAEAGRLQAEMPQLTARSFGGSFAARASHLRQRRIDAALQAGVPPGA